MKILFTGGGTGGHFYPLIAVVEALEDLVRERKLLEPEYLYAAPEPYDKELLLAHGIKFVPTAAGKVRNYTSILNFFDYFKTGWGVLRSAIRIFFVYPDVIFSTGGYASFPTLLSARLFKIPVVLLNCDASAGKVARWAAPFAVRIAAAFPEGAASFPKEKVAYTGNPVRKSALLPAREGAFEFLKLDPTLPVLLVLGGSQGSQTLNDALIAALPQLIEEYQVVHQTGEDNFDEVAGRARVAMGDSLKASRYKPFGYLNDLALRMTAGAASLVIARAGAGTIFEVAAWGTPSILIPIPEPTSHDQTKNAFSYARAGAAIVIEQQNLTPGLLHSEIRRILGSEPLKHAMQNAARAFSRPDAAKVIAEQLADIALSHES
jgi:UDP-N-acetylglucosamine--N-acetylmuramyl-(pentapeptide) pyrophosphoryl-undecaprenol N-acetylglucosamine transferase